MEIFIDPTVNKKLIEKIRQAVSDTISSIIEFDVSVSIEIEIGDADTNSVDIEIGIDDADTN